MSKIKIGDRFDRWTVIGKAETPTRAKQGPYWFCQCLCGTKRAVLATSLSTERSRSCGCLQRDGAKARGRKVQVHGERHPPTKEYRAWRAMKARCSNPNGPEYHRYGGRGVTVCSRWIHSYKNFLADMGRAPSPNHSVDRIDNDGNYEPSNCRWSTRTEQRRNSVDNKMLSFEGKSRCLSEWSEITGIKTATLWRRIYDHNWSIERALTTPVKVLR